MNAMSPSHAVDLTALRLSVLAMGYVPIPVTAPDYRHPKVKSPGKQPFFKGWQNVSADTIDAQVVEGWTHGIANHPSTGLLCGHLVGLDIDVPAEDLSAEMMRLASAMLGVTPLHRIGNAPKILLCYRTATPMRKMETPELKLDNGATVQVEVMGVGQQVVGFGVHPATGNPYTWPNGTPERVPLANLPMVAEPALRTFLAAAEMVLRAAGGLTDKERAATTEPTRPAEPTVARSRRPVGAKETKGSDFFRQVNTAALDAIGSWLPTIFPKATRQDGTGAWRVSSADLGRQLEEDISVHPTEGGHDFGIRQSCSPIDIVQEHGGAPDAKDAAFWLCEKLGKIPANFGWKAGKERRSAQNKQTPATETDGERPLIQVTAGELHLTATAGETAIIREGLAVYQRGNALVRPVVQEVAAAHGRMTHSAALHEIEGHGLIDALCKSATWERYDARSEAFVRINPPRNVADIILSRAGMWTFPKVVGVITTPTIRPDGSILSAPGYDRATRLYHAADAEVVLSPAVQNPTRESADKALALLSGLLAEFPFVSEVGRAVALSGLITPVVRGALAVAPLHAFRANAPGSGKSYLVDIASAISSGRPCPVASAGGDEGETEKRLTGLLLAGFPIASLDNLNGELGGDLLCQAIERPFIRLRPLGRSDIVEVESRATLFATGNGLRVRGDMVRRTVVGDLDAGMERPELRPFEGNPVATVMAKRGLYVSACLIIVRAYILADRPGVLPPIASFADWSDTVRSALVWLGCSDPAASMDVAREDDPELTELREIIEVWKASLPIGQAMTCKQVSDWSEGKKADEEGRPTNEWAWPDLRDVLMRIGGDRGAVSMNRVGAKFRKHEGRIVSGHRIKRDTSVASPVARWKVEDVACSG